MTEDILQFKVTTSLSMTVEDQLWLKEQREKDSGFTLTKFVRESIANARK